MSKITKELNKMITRFTVIRNTELKNSEKKAEEEFLKKYQSNIDSLVNIAIEKAKSKAAVGIRYFEITESDVDSTFKSAYKSSIPIHPHALFRKIAEKAKDQLVSMDFKITDPVTEYAELYYAFTWK